MTTPLISIVLGSYNRIKFLKTAVQSIRDNGIDVPYEIIVIDGGSTDGSIGWLVKQKDIITIVQHNHGTWGSQKLQRRSWGYFMNIAFQSAHGKYILMMSDDSLLVPGAAMNGYVNFEKLLDKGRRIGALAFYWRNSPEVKRYSVMKIFEKVYVNHGMYLRSALAEVGWIDEINYKFYYADVDLCLRMDRGGHETMACKEAIVEHYAMPDDIARQGNLALSQTNDDFKHFILRWHEVFKVPVDIDSERIVSFDYLDFMDPFQTASKFPRGNKYFNAAVFAQKVFRRIERLRKSLFGSKQAH